MTYHLNSNVPQITPKVKELCRIVYNRSRKVYQVKNGKLIGEFPAGPEGQTAAKWAAITHDNAAAARIARRLLAEGLADEQRIVKAARLVIEGKITAHRRDGDYTAAQVQASDGNRSAVTGWPFYLVNHNLKWTCDCEDYQRHQAAGLQHKCKHILATMILQVLQDEQAADFAAAAERKQADRLERLANGRGRREGHTYEIAPGDGGISDQDLAAPLPAEYERMLRQAEAQRQAEQRATALPVSVDNRDRLEDMLGYELTEDNDGTGRWAAPTVSKPRSQAAAMGDEIKRLLGQEPTDDNPPVRKPTEAEIERGYAAALRSQQPKSRIGSLPTEWQYRR